MTRWLVERVVQFARHDFVKSGVAHFGFHVRDGRYFALAHRDHYLGFVGEEERVEWTVGARKVFDDVSNIAADIEFPMYVDVLRDGTLVVSNFRSARLYRVDPATMAASLLVDGHDLGMADMGNCVVDEEGLIWVNEVTGCRVWRFDDAGRVVETLGDGVPGFQGETVEFDRVRFSWIYDLRRAPDGSIYVLDSKNFALRAIHLPTRTVRLVAGSGRPGYAGDGEAAEKATFGSDPTAAFDGPISLSVDEAGNAYVGDRFNCAVRMIDRGRGIITTVAGRRGASAETPNDPSEHDPLRLNLPMISSLDYDRGRLYVPTDLEGDAGDLIVLGRSTADER